MNPLEILAALGDIGIFAVAGVLWYHVRECKDRQTDSIEQRRVQWKEVTWLTRCMERVGAKLDIELPPKDTGK